MMFVVLLLRGMILYDYILYALFQFQVWSLLGSVVMSRLFRIMKVKSLHSSELVQRQ